MSGFVRFFRILEFFRMVLIQPESRPAKCCTAEDKKMFEVGKLLSGIQKSPLFQGYDTAFGVSFIQVVLKNVILF